MLAASRHRGIAASRHRGIAARWLAGWPMNCPVRMLSTRAGRVVSC
jgi:hypothetical protein